MGEQSLAGLLDAARDSIAVLLSHDVKRLEDHQRQRALPDFGLGAHIGFPYEYAGFRWESNRNFCGRDVQSLHHMAPAPGSSIGPYQVGDRIGAGGMGQVLKARDTRLNRTVALKVLGERCRRTAGARCCSGRRRRRRP